MSQSISDRRHFDSSLDRAMQRIEWEDEHCWPNVGPSWGELIACALVVAWKWIVFAGAMLIVAGVVVGVLA